MRSAWTWPLITVGLVLLVAIAAIIVMLVVAVDHDPATTCQNLGGIMIKSTQGYVCVSKDIELP